MKIQRCSVNPVCSGGPDQDLEPGDPALPPRGSQKRCITSLEKVKKDIYSVD